MDWATDYFIRPPRSQNYTLPVGDNQIVNKTSFVRRDVEIMNKKGLCLKCSLFKKEKLGERRQRPLKNKIHMSHPPVLDGVEHATRRKKKDYLIESMVNELKPKAVLEKSYSVPNSPKYVIKIKSAESVKKVKSPAITRKPLLEEPPSPKKERNLNLKRSASEDKIKKKKRLNANSIGKVPSDEKKSNPYLKPPRRFSKKKKDETIEGHPDKNRPRSKSLTSPRRDNTLKNLKRSLPVSDTSKIVKQEIITKNSPCIIYLHGNSGCRAEAVEYLQMLSCYDISLFCFDFAGCGQSEGKFISLGWHEKDDIKTVIDHLKTNEGYEKFILWGRSMGASSALLYCSHFLEDSQKLIIGMILDSPFCSLKKVAEDLVSIQKGATILTPLLNITFNTLRKNIKKKAGFDLRNLEFSKNVGKIECPVIFIHAQDDMFVQPYHSQFLYESYAGNNKKFFIVSGDHNSKRKEDCMNLISTFLFNILNNHNLNSPKKPAYFCPFEDKPHFCCQYVNIKSKNTQIHEVKLDSKLEDYVLLVHNKCIKVLEPFIGTEILSLPLESHKKYTLLDNKTFAIVTADESHLFYTNQAKELKSFLTSQESANLNKKCNDHSYEGLLSTIEKMASVIISDYLQEGKCIIVNNVATEIFNTIKCLVILDTDQEELHEKIKEKVEKVLSQKTKK